MNIENNDDIDNNIILNNDIDNNNECIICWEANGKIILCGKCKFKYCDLCVKKTNSKCCVCYRISIRKYDYTNDNYFYDDSYQPIFQSQYILTYIISTFMSIISFIVTCIGFGFFILLLIRLFVMFIS